MEFKQLLINLEVDTELVLHRFSNNEQLLKRFLCKFSDDQTFSKLEIAYKVGQYMELQNTAHSLKGIAANLGFSTLSFHCHDMIEILKNQFYDRIDEQFELIHKEYTRIVVEIKKYSSSI